MRAFSHNVFVRKMIDFRLMTISNFMITRVWCFIFFLFCKLVYEVSANIARLFYIRTPCYSMSSAFSLPYHPMLNYIVWQDMMIEDFACQVISRNFYYLFPVSDLLLYHQNTIQFIIWNMIEQKYIVTWYRVLKNFPFSPKLNPRFIILV